MKTLALDIGSTTLKCVVLNERGDILFKDYKRHKAHAGELCANLTEKLSEEYKEPVNVVVSGSAGMGLAENFGLSFVQEVYAERTAAKKLSPGADIVIELGGEDAKIIFLTGGFEMRMNGSCAGGTGAFIDQMASLMNISTSELGELASRHGKIYNIASRCGVFAKSDVQPLLNQGAKREDVASGILYAVVNQTVAGLAQGREIKGNVLYLGGPLTFLPELRRSFDDVLKVNGVCPEDSLYYVALGAAYTGAARPADLAALSKKMRRGIGKASYEKTEPLFKSKKEYEEFKARHKKSSEGIKELEAPAGEMCLGIDAGSTTVKLLLADKDGNIFRSVYKPNRGNPVNLVKDYLEALYADFPDIKIRASAVTGYGEELVKSAFGVDFGLVETVAHFTAAKRFRPDVDFILDIGGQDIKCFRIRGGAIDSIFLNEACSSGCGSFLQTFAGALDYSAEEFSKLGLFAARPVDLGSRCTVFMNSAVKQAQKDGATVPDISAGLSISVVKNALYKVIRCAFPEALGKNIVVQGGTFLSDAVLRAFEREIGRSVIRPAFAPLMGAYGAALYAFEKSKEGDRSSILGQEALKNFIHEAKAVTCKGCGNRCHLTINSFGGGGKFIAGNRCERPLGKAPSKSLDIYEYKTELLQKYRKNELSAGALTIGIPMGLNFYELLPFWHAFWKKLGFNVLVSPPSDRALYRLGQHTIPSDTVCYPAKLMHGHVEWLLSQNPDAVFYPDMSYNFDEGLGVNHYNCPVVAYYPEVLKNNAKSLRKLPFINDCVSLNDKKQFEKRIYKIVNSYFPGVSRKAIEEASNAAYIEYENYQKAVRKKGDEIIKEAKEKDMPTVVLAGRPYHLDKEVNHGINRLICSLGAAVISEDSLMGKEKPFSVGVRNQWTYHARLYAAAKYIAKRKDAGLLLVQLVSFGCGLDAVTTDEVRSILEDAGMLYTQLKIDEISNMGAVKIRLRSLLSAAGK